MPSEAQISAFREGDIVYYNEQKYYFIRYVRQFRQDMVEIAEIPGRNYCWLPDECFWDLSQRTLRIPADYVSKDWKRR